MKRRSTQVRKEVSEIREEMVLVKQMTFVMHRSKDLEESPGLIKMWSYLKNSNVEKRSAYMPQPKSSSELLDEVPEMEDEELQDYYGVAPQV